MNRPPISKVPEPKRTKKEFDFNRTEIVIKLGRLWDREGQNKYREITEFDFSLAMD